MDFEWGAVRTKVMLCRSCCDRTMELKALQDIISTVLKWSNHTVHLLEMFPSTFEANMQLLVKLWKGFVTCQAWAESVIFVRLSTDLLWHIAPSLLADKTWAKLKTWYLIKQFDRPPYVSFSFNTFSKVDWMNWMTVFLWLPANVFEHTNLKPVEESTQVCSY